MTRPHPRGLDDPWASRASAWLTVTLVCTAVIAGTLAAVTGMSVSLVIGTVLLGIPLGILLILITTELNRRRRHARWEQRVAAGFTDALGRPVTAITHPTGLRLRIRYITHPRPALILTDTARPSCHLCLGQGGWIEPYPAHDGEYAGQSPVYCDCWTPWHHTLLPVPRRLALAAARIADRRHTTAGFSDEPPF